jgi:hypothetical protein
MGVRDYSTTAASNASVSGQNWSEGQAPSTVNDSARKALADLAELFELMGGKLTTAGTANAQTLTPTVAWTAYTDGDWFAAVIGNTLTNTGSVTMNVSGLGAKTVYKRDGATTLVAGDLVAGSLYNFTYDAGINGFRLESGASSLDDVTTAGSDVASDATIVLDTASGGIVDVTGTTTITAITLAEGNIRFVRFTGALTLTHGASLVLPGAANITTVAGDWAIFIGDASSVVRCVAYLRAPTVPATASDLTSGGNSKVVTPGTIKRYTATGETIASNTTISKTHGLGAKPYFVQLSIVMGASTEAGYAEGDEVYINPVDNGSSGTNGAFGLLVSSTTIDVIMANGDTNIVIPNKSTRATTAIDITKWTLTIRAML